MISHVQFKIRAALLIGFASETLTCCVEIRFRSVTKSSTRCISDYRHKGIPIYTLADQ